jgi:very-short-patch-repair endonuclease
VSLPAQPPVPHLITGQKLEPAKAEYVRQLRREMTPEEKLLWEQVRANRLRGLHFRRQQLVHGFIADFYCHAAGVVVEVDGDIHDEQVEYDAARDLAFTTIGLLVLRFRNEEVTTGMPHVLERLVAACAERIAACTEPNTE